MTEKRMTNEELAQEAARWDNGKATPADWQDAPDAVPRAGESVAVSIRLPKKLLNILKEFARREGIGYQVLMKRWLDERVRGEYQRVKVGRQPIEAMVSSITVQAQACDVQGNVRKHRPKKSQ